MDQSHIGFMPAPADQFDLENPLVSEVDNTGHFEFGLDLDC